MIKKGVISNITGSKAEAFIPEENNAVTALLPFAKSINPLDVNIGDKCVIALIDNDNISLANGVIIAIIGEKAPSEYDIEDIIANVEALKKKKHTVIKELYSGGGALLNGSTSPAKTSILTQIDNSNGSPLYYQIAVDVEALQGCYFDTIILPHSTFEVDTPTRFYKEGYAGGSNYKYTLNGLIACEGTSDYVSIEVTTSFNGYTHTPKVYIYGVYEE